MRDGTILFVYKNFDLNVTMRGAFGFQIINGGRMNYENVKNSRFENLFEVCE